MKWGFVAVAVVILLAVISAIMGGGNKDDSGSSASSTTSEVSPSSDTALCSTGQTSTAPEPAAIDASPYVLGFGDLSVVSLPAGDPDAVTIIATAPVAFNGVVSLIVRNNTREAVGQIDITGTARDADGKLVGSGDSSSSLQPRVVAPGEIAFGSVYFKTDSPAGADLNFSYTINTQPPDTFFVPLTVTEVNNTGDNSIGSVRNDSGDEVKGPIKVNVLCFGSGGNMILAEDGFLEGLSGLEAGATGTFGISLLGKACPAGIVASSGYGHL